MATLDDRSRMLRSMAIDALEGGSRGHIGSTMSLIEILRVLFDDVMTFDPSFPMLPGRDRLILSKGHGCIALYVMLADKGFFSHEELATFCRYTSTLGGHPEHGHVPGVEASTGALGHGLAIGVGMAYAARLSESSHHVFVVMGDGELDEGSVWESALAAGHHRLDNLTVVVDYNKLQSYGPVAEVWDLEPLAAKWSAFGFDSAEVDGHDVAALQETLSLPSPSQRPRAIIAHTVKGRGISFAEGEPTWHHKSNLKPEELAALRAAVLNA
ncbi:transketolase [Actinomycetota bacterium]|nr:transketolase [Actinomycetota bacterium]